MLFDQRAAQGWGWEGTRRKLLLNFRVTVNSHLRACVRCFVKHSLNSCRKLKANTSQRFLRLIILSISFVFVRFIYLMPFRLLFQPPKRPPLWSSTPLSLILKRCLSLSAVVPFSTLFYLPSATIPFYQARSRVSTVNLSQYVSCAFATRATTPATDLRVPISCIRETEGERGAKGVGLKQKMEDFIRED